MKVLIVEDKNLDLKLYTEIMEQSMNGRFIHLVSINKGHTTPYPPSLSRSNLLTA